MLFFMKFCLFSSYVVRKAVLSCCFLLLVSVGYSQPENTVLSRLPYKVLEDSIFKNEFNPAPLKSYLEAYREKAYRESNVYQQYIYHKNFVFFRPDNQRMPHIDTALVYAFRLRDKALIGGAYLTQGTIYNTHKNYQAILESYLKAYDYILQTDNDYLLYRTKNHIAAIKNYLGHYEEASGLYKECVGYFAKDLTLYNNQRGWLSSMRGLSWSYIKTGNYDKAQTIIDEALTLAKETQVSELDEKYLLLRKGINSYYLKEYDKAIKTLSASLPAVYENDDFAWSAIGEHYIGRSLWDKGSKKEALPYFIKADSVFQTKHYSHPDLRAGYERLISYYKDQNDTENQLKYINKLVETDQYLSESYKYLSQKIHKEYDTKTLLLVKNELENRLISQNQAGNSPYLIVLLSICLLVSAYLIYNSRKKKTLPVLNIIENAKLTKTTENIKITESTKITETVESFTTTSKTPKKTRVSSETCTAIIKQLTLFEQEEKFRKKGVTQAKLASAFKTNTTYLSEVINTHKGKKFSKYLNDLRIGYITNKLETDKKYREYSYEKLAEICGYESSSRFSEAFFLTTNSRPIEFIEKLSQKALKN